MSIHVSLGLHPIARAKKFQALCGFAAESRRRRLQALPFCKATCAKPYLVGSFIGPMSASFQINPPGASGKGDLETAVLYGRRIAELTRQFVRGKSA